MFFLPCCSVFCRFCHDTGHVCENHPDRPWAGIADTCTGACDCGAGMPCPACCSPLPIDGTPEDKESTSKFPPRACNTPPLAGDDIDTTPQRHPYPRRHIMATINEARELVTTIVTTYPRERHGQPVQPREVINAVREGLFGQYGRTLTGRERGELSTEAVRLAIAAGFYSH